MDTVDRIFKLAETKYREQRDFASAIGVTPSIVSEWKRRKSSSYSKPKHINRIGKELGVSVQWLLTGEEPSPQSKTPGVEALPDVFVRFSTLSPGAQKEVIEFIEFKHTQELGGKHE